jgi:hypothetical protein
MKMQTKYGTAKPNHEGYYTITSRKEGYHRKYLHKLISNNKGTVTYSQKSTYYNICGRIIRVSEDKNRSSLYFYCSEKVSA